MKEEKKGKRFQEGNRSGTINTQSLSPYSGDAGPIDSIQAQQNTELSLQERIKELTCLYGIMQHIMKDHSSNDELFQGIVDRIPPAWQYPEITVGRISIDDTIYATADFKKAYHKLTSNIMCDSKKRGVVEVIYTKK